MSGPFGRQFAVKQMQGVDTPPSYSVGGPLARVGSPPPNAPLGDGGHGDGFGAQQQPQACPAGVPWWFIPLGVAGVVQALSWLVSRR